MKNQTTHNTTSNDVSFVHPLFLKHEHQWQLCRDMHDGIDTAKKHLLQHSQEKDEDFEERYELAVLDNYVERIKTTQAGKIFRKPISYENVNESLIEAFEAMDISEFTKDFTANAILDGKAYIFVDMPKEGGDPYFIHVHRNQLINWRKDADGNFTMAVIRELYAEEEEFKLEYRWQLRHLDMYGNHYVYREVKGQFELYEEIITTYGNVNLFELDIGDVPPLYDIAVINKNHFNAFSDKDCIVSKATRPSFFTNGLGLDDNTELKLGVNYSINTDNPDADVKWIELTGESIPIAQDDLERKQKMMEVRALQSQKDGAKIKTATQANKEDSESTARLSDIAEDSENALNKAMNAWHKMKFTKEITGNAVINKDFRDDAIDSNIILGLNGLVLAGNLSRETMIRSLIKHEIVEIESVEEEIKKIDSEFIPQTQGD